MSQPEWETIYNTDIELLQTDKTGVFAPELERAEEYTTDRGRTRFLLFRVQLEQLSVSPTQLTLTINRPRMGHIPTLVDSIDAYGVEHRPWFEDDMHDGPGPGFCIVEDRSAFCPTCGHWVSLDLSDAARSAGIKASKLRRLFCSDDPRKRAWAYGVIAGYHGWNNFDDYPLNLTEKQLTKRWG